MRLDKLLSITGTATRSEAKRAIRRGAVRIGQAVATRADTDVDPERDTVLYEGRPVVYRRYTYILLNKPEGVVSATDDPRERTVLDLLPEELRRLSLFPCGRLDKNTLGLVLLTDNGALAHSLLSPKHHVSKEYYFRCQAPMTEREAAMFRKGLTLEDGYVTKPADIRLLGDGTEGYITLVEGKYHQIKRMLQALDNKIVYLERIRFANLSLGEHAPERGEWRFLTEEEASALEALADTQDI